MKPRIAVALSGGGFRASVFHLGVLLRLAEIGWLPYVDVLSTVSGGSIVGAFAVQRWPALLAAGGGAAAYRSVVLEPFLERVRANNFILRWLYGAWAWPFRKLSTPAFTRTKAAADLFDELFFDGASCASLPASPLLILNATNLQSIRAWRFTREGLGDSRIGHAEWGTQPLSLGECVGASAAFPPVFPPARIRRADYSFSLPIHEEDLLEPYPLIPLSDGGVYDNSGLEAVCKAVKVPGYEELIEPAELLVVSDGGSPARYQFNASGIPAITDAELLYRVDGIAREQVSALRRRMLMDSFSGGKRCGIFVGMSSHVGRLPKAMYKEYTTHCDESCLLPARIRARIERIRTSLDRFEGIEVEALLYHAYSMTAAFTWSYRGTFPERFRTVDLNELWRLSFDEARIAYWDTRLSSASKAMRVR